MCIQNLARMSASSSPTNYAIKSRQSIFGYEINFSIDDTMDVREGFHREGDLNKWPTAGQALNDFKVLQITQNFIPVGTEVTGGYAEIVINGIEEDIEITPQITKVGFADGYSSMTETK